MFGRRSRAKRLKAGAQGGSLGAALLGAYSGARPVAERLLYDDDLRDNIRILLESSRKILDEVSDEEPTEIVARLWDDRKLRNEIETAAPCTTSCGLGTDSITPMNSAWAPALPRGGMPIARAVAAAMRRHKCPE